MTRAPFIAALTLTLVLAVASAALAHPMPPLTGPTLILSEENLVLELMFRGDVWDDWVPGDAKALAERFGKGDAEVKREMTRALASFVRIAIDDVEVTPVLEQFKSSDIIEHEVHYTLVDLRAAYGTKGRPRRVSILWKRFDTTFGWDVSPIDAEIDAYGVWEYPVLRRREPEFIWHAPIEGRGRGAEVDVEPIRMPATVPVPLVSAGIVAALFLVLPVALLARAPRRRLLVAAAAGGVLAIAVSGLARHEVELPWEAGFSMPDEERALALFTTLHRNIYRAFDYEDEEAIYDTLARTVEGDLLDRIYTEVRQSLILREEGGAEAKIQATEIREARAEIPDDPRVEAFSVEARWRVRGKVRHYEHEHVRVNEYAGRFVVRWQGRGWKISSVEILDQKRLTAEDRRE